MNILTPINNENNDTKKQRVSEADLLKTKSASFNAFVSQLEFDDSYKLVPQHQPRWSIAGLSRISSTLVF